jgi:hypothetical protein
MRLFGRAPGAVYRVYGEDEYLECETQPVGPDGRDDSLGGDPRPASRALNPSRPRLAGPRPAALLVATMIVVLAAIAAVLVLDVTMHRGSRHAVTASATDARQLARRPIARQWAVRPSHSRSSPAHAHNSMHVEHRVPRVSAHADPRLGAGTSVSPVGAAAAPAAVAPTASSYRPAEGGSDNALSEFGFER